MVRETGFLYDDRDRLTDTIEWDGGKEYRTRNVYDKGQNKLEVYTGMLGSSTSGADKTTYTYDQYGNILTMIDPRSNRLSLSNSLYRMEKYEYDSTGRLKQKTDRNQHTTHYEYDPLP